MDRREKWRIAKQKEGKCIQCGKEKKEKTLLCKDCTQKQVAINKTNRGSK